MSKFLPISGFKWIDREEIDLNNDTGNNSKRFFLEFNIECQKELPQLHNYFPLAPDKIDLKREMLFEYQLKIAELYNILISNVKN